MGKTDHDCIISSYQFQALDLYYCQKMDCFHGVLNTAAKRLS